MSLAAGARLGPYEILSALGAGGMGEVYRARDPRLGRDVAIKTVRGLISHEQSQRLELEARATAALNHPNIVAVYDVGFASDLAYIVTELLEGETLHALLRRGPLDVPHAISMASQIADALAAAHAKGIVHRDLKPENVFVLPGGRIKVLDFGLAKLIAADDAVGASLETMSALTVAGEVVGTAAYLAPEQARCGAVDFRADIFSFGCVLYEMLAGHSPFRADTFADTLIAILKEPRLRCQETCTWRQRSTGSCTAAWTRILTGASSRRATCGLH
jgi:serine/threonine protein kinase